MENYVLSRVATGAQPVRKLGASGCACKSRSKITVYVMIL